MGAPCNTAHVIDGFKGLLGFLRRGWKLPAKSICSFARLVSRTDRVLGISHHLWTRAAVIPAIRANIAAHTISDCLDLSTMCCQKSKPSCPSSPSIALCRRMCWPHPEFEANSGKHDRLSSFAPLRLLRQPHLVCRGRVFPVAGTFKPDPLLFRLTQH
ncbi:hypothetical protein K469DRAFT_721094 [Zopfia rhizophila CBS 207.26]|uniref:Uncharacterized protein n=1 Tax=Zopfia rhizophila CBS 207.26 TaxID=1314779 RepID=A0A6A6DC47_9PEZI|nr:hypothetical protein K469DRAFT_721094 [Zopfia rhizophila CBS 207.26]